MLNLNKVLKHRMPIQFIVSWSVERQCAPTSSRERRGALGRRVGVVNPTKRACFEVVIEKYTCANVWWPNQLIKKRRAHLTWFGSERLVLRLEFWNRNMSPYRDLSKHFSPRSCDPCRIEQILRAGHPLNVPELCVLWASDSELNRLPHHR